MLLRKREKTEHLKRIVNQGNFNVILLNSSDSISIISDNDVAHTTIVVESNKMSKRKLSSSVIIDDFLMTNLQFRQLLIITL